ncbi:MAG: hypothetical protein LBU81_05350 [Methanosarcinales archaeon]|jgi:hypothetical protein|nr:hypothetical protein [Methanosarcinales archaeon]
MNATNRKELCECTFTEEETRNCVGVPSEDLEEAVNYLRKWKGWGQDKKELSLKRKHSIPELTPELKESLAAFEAWCNANPKFKIKPKSPEERKERSERSADFRRKRLEARLKKKKESEEDD